MIIDNIEKKIFFDKDVRHLIKFVNVNNISREETYCFIPKENKKISLKKVLNEEFMIFKEKPKHEYVFIVIKEKKEK